MIYQGHIEKMTSKVDGVVHYALPLDDLVVDMDALQGKRIRIEYLNEIKCTACGKITSKSYGQGFCYPCFVSAPEASECVLNPEKCKAHLGEARDLKWAEQHCLIEHIVYLAYSGNLKVGVTRHNQIPTRWIDQGASAAIVLARTPNRHIAGVIEVFLKQYFSDKTQWQQMLCNGGVVDVNLEEEKSKAVALLPVELQQFVSVDNTVANLVYPFVNGKPDEILQVTFDKQKVVEGELTGIKGQYLLIDNKFGLNVRRHRGYLVRVEMC